MVKNIGQQYVITEELHKHDAEISPFMVTNKSKIFDLSMKIRNGIDIDQAVAILRNLADTLELLEVKSE